MLTAIFRASTKQVALTSKMKKNKAPNPLRSKDMAGLWNMSVVYSMFITCGISVQIWYLAIINFHAETEIIVLFSNYVNICLNGSILIGRSLKMHVQISFIWFNTLNANLHMSDYTVNNVQYDYKIIWVSVGLFSSI